MKVFLHCRDSTTCSPRHPDFAQKTTAEQREFLSANLSKANAETFISLPEGADASSNGPRPHGNVQVSLIETENSSPGWSDAASPR